MNIWIHTNGIDIRYFFICVSTYLFIFQMKIFIQNFASNRIFTSSIPLLVIPCPALIFEVCHKFFAQCGALPARGDTTPLSRAEVSSEHPGPCPSQEHPRSQRSPPASLAASVSPRKAEGRLWPGGRKVSVPGEVPRAPAGHWALCAGLGPAVCPLP